MQQINEKVLQAIDEFKAGEMVILTDHPDRENEGDLVIPAEMITPEIINFMIRNGTGIICLSLTAELSERFDLPLMVTSNNSKRGTPFTVSIDAKDGITTGVSAADRAQTIRLLVSDTATSHDFVKPGHVFPLQARDGGVLERNGHTEGSVDLAKLAGFKAAAVICEIMNKDGSMAKNNEITEFAKEHGLHMLSIDELIMYRQCHENLIEEITPATSLPIDQYGTFVIQVFKEKFTQLEHLVLYKKTNKKITNVRIHSSCTTGDIFSSQRCDCHHQLHFSLDKISKEGGVVIYLNQEGRGIGLLNKIKCYALQDQGLNTIEANEHLHLPIDARKYYMAAHILRYFHLEKINLLTNNPQKFLELKAYGFAVNMQMLPPFYNEHNKNYIKTKIEKLNHQFQIN